MRGPKRHRRLAFTAALLVLVAAVAACEDGGGSKSGTATSTVPAVMQSEPAVTGVLDAGGVNGARFRLVEVSDSYFEGGSIQIEPQDPIVMSDTGESITADGLVAGMRVEVWVYGCDETYLVQCYVEAIRVLA